jgi:hypothetical protein
MSAVTRSHLQVPLTPDISYCRPLMCGVPVLHARSFNLSRPLDFFACSKGPDEISSYPSSRCWSCDQRSGAFDCHCRPPRIISRKGLTAAANASNHHDSVTSNHRHSNHGKASNNEPRNDEPRNDRSGDNKSGNNESRNDKSGDNSDPTTADNATDGRTTHRQAVPNIAETIYVGVIKLRRSICSGNGHSSGRHRPHCA